MAGIDPQQGPPLSVPFSFFFTAPLSLCVAGALLAWRGAQPEDQLGLVHLGTVGFLLFVMLGALYQMLPVVAGAVVPYPRTAHLVHALLLAGAGTLIAAQLTGMTSAFTWAVGLLSAALLAFLLPAVWAVARTRMQTPTVWGLRLALLALAAVGFAGLRLAWTRGGHALTTVDWLALRLAHIYLGLVTWVGGLICAVSWQVLPMFYLVASPPKRLTRVMLAGIGASLLCLWLVTVTPIPHRVVPFLIAPGALAVWVVLPAWAMWAMYRRKRKRRDPTLWFWWLSMGLAPGCLVLAALSASTPWWTATEWAPKLFGLVVLWGWAGALVHGMLMRIVPFLAWMHFCAPRIGQPGVPAIRELLPDRKVAIGAMLHLLTLCAGLGGVMIHSIAWSLFGVGLIFTGIWLIFLSASTVVRSRSRN